jgi:hypothetical protein
MWSIWVQPQRQYHHDYLIAAEKLGDHHDLWVALPIRIGESRSILALDPFHEIDQGFWFVVIEIVPLAESMQRSPINLR